MAYDFESHILIAHPELLDPGAGLLGEIDSYNRQKKSDLSSSTDLKMQKGQEGIHKKIL